MNYHYYFEHKFIFFVVLFGLFCLAVLFFWFNNSYWDDSKFFQNNPKVKLIIRIGLTVLAIDCFF